MRPPQDIDRDKLKARTRALIAHLSTAEPDARAEVEAAQQGTLEQDDRTSLRVIEGKFEHMATKAELTAAVRQLEASIERLRNWALGLIIALLLTVIGVLVRLLIGLVLNILMSPQLPPVSGYPGVTGVC